MSSEKRMRSTVAGKIRTVANYVCTVHTVLVRGGELLVPRYSYYVVLSST